MDAIYNIPKEVLKEWKGLRGQGDGEAIIKESGIGKNDISRAFKKGKCNEKVFESLFKYYRSKQKKVMVYVEDVTASLNQALIREKKLRNALEWYQVMAETLHSYSITQNTMATQSVVMALASDGGSKANEALKRNV